METSHLDKKYCPFVTIAAALAYSNPYAGAQLCRTDCAFRNLCKSLQKKDTDKYQGGI